MPPDFVGSSKNKKSKPALAMANLEKDIFSYDDSPTKIEDSKDSNPLSPNQFNKGAKKLTQAPPNNNNASAIPGLSNMTSMISSYMT